MAGQFDIMPIEEMRVRLLRYKNGVSGFTFGRNKITILDIAKLAVIRRMILYYIMNADFKGDHKNSFGPKRRLRVSRVLVKVDSGLITKKDGKLVYHDAPTKEVPKIGRVKMTISGPILDARNPERKAGTMPSFLRAFGTQDSLLPKEFKWRS